MTGSSMQRNQHDSPLLRLPRELRNDIFEHVLASTTYEVSICWTKRYPNNALESSLKVRVPRWEQLPPDLSLLQVSRQVYAETFLLPFKLHTFYFNIRLRDIPDFLHRLTPAQRAAIKDVHVQIDAMPNQHWNNKNKIMDGGMGFLYLLPGVGKVHVELSTICRLLVKRGVLKAGFKDRLEEACAERGRQISVQYQSYQRRDWAVTTEDVAISPFRGGRTSD